MSAAKEVIKRFMAVFGEPRTPDPDTFLVEFERSLEGYDAKALRKACDTLIRKSTFWPKPAEVIEIAATILTERQHHRDSSVPLRAFVDQAKDANSMIRCELGERAARDGWILGLWDFCRSRNRLPNEYEVRDLIAKRREHEEIVAALARVPSALNNALLNLAAGMAERSKQLCEIVDGTRNDLTPVNVKWGSA